MISDFAHQKFILKWHTPRPEALRINSIADLRLRQKCWHAPTLPTPLMVLDRGT